MYRVPGAGDVCPAFKKGVYRNKIVTYLLPTVALNILPRVRTWDIRRKDDTDDAYINARLSTLPHL